jgi:hypothetical protein
MLALTHVIEEIKFLEVRLDELHEERTWDLILTMDG